MNSKHSSFNVIAAKETDHLELSDPAARAKSGLVHRFQVGFSKSLNQDIHHSNLHPIELGLFEVNIFIGSIIDLETSSNKLVHLDLCHKTPVTYRAPGTSLF
jgi:hypothetical protein